MKYLRPSLVGIAAAALANALGNESKLISMALAGLCALLFCGTFQTSGMPPVVLSRISASFRRPPLPSRMVTAGLTAWSIACCLHWVRVESWTALMITTSWIAGLALGYAWKKGGDA